MLSFVLAAPAPGEDAAAVARAIGEQTGLQALTRHEAGGLERSGARKVSRERRPGRLGLVSGGSAGGGVELLLPMGWRRHEQVGEIERQERVRLAGGEFHREVVDLADRENVCESGDPAREGPQLGGTTGEVLGSAHDVEVLDLCRSRKHHVGVLRRVGHEGIVDHGEEVLAAHPLGHAAMVRRDCCGIRVVDAEGSHGRRQVVRQQVAPEIAHVQRAHPRLMFVRQVDGVDIQR